MRKYDIHTTYHLPAAISGETLREAVNSNLDVLAWESKGNGHGIRDLSLESLEYSPGIFGGKGGVVAKIRAYDMADDRWTIIEAWIHAGAADLAEEDNNGQ